MGSGNRRSPQGGEPRNYSVGPNGVSNKQRRRSPTPGGVGPYEFLGQVSLSGFFAVPAADAAAAAVTLHAIALLPTIVIGLAFMWRDGLRPSEVRTVAAAGPAWRGNA